ncbi:uncharacterized protein LOC116304419 [Actinia tenebrosa]|uniref:Ashwin n=1 Tax=Actinia tenebrosa TaxID=6105 RepID=A0A6P8IS73_ACTTE|nr:uncharacterized protein LOC116304419 [Actinia tenebrosa]
MAASGTSFIQQNLDHPEILDRENLIEILCDRSIPLDEIKDLDKQELVNLFYKFVAPLPQRLHQLRRGKREPPKTTERTLAKKTANSIKGRKRLSDVQNSVVNVKIPKSDLEHVLINNGPSKLKPKTQEADLSPNTNLKRPRVNQEDKAKPVKLNRKFVNLKLSSPSGNSSSKSVNGKNEKTGAKEKDRNHEPETTSDSTSSHSTDEELKQIRKKFKEISWP